MVYLIWIVITICVSTILNSLNHVNFIVGQFNFFHIRFIMDSSPGSKLKVTLLVIIQMGNKRRPLWKYNRYFAVIFLLRWETWNILIPNVKAWGQISHTQKLTNIHPMILLYILPVLILPYNEHRMLLQTLTWAKQIFNYYFNSFHAIGLLLYPHKTSANLWFSDVFRGYKKRPVAWNELTKFDFIDWFQWPQVPRKSLQTLTATRYLFVPFYRKGENM